VLELTMKGKYVRLWIFLALMLLLFVGCSEETSTRPEHPEKKKGTEKIEKQPVKEQKDEEGANVAKKQETAPHEESPKEMLASQYRHINTGDYKAAYALFDAQSQQTVSLAQYRAYFRNNAPYSIDRYSFPSVEVSGDSATVTADLSVHSTTGHDRYQVTQQLVRQDGGWRVVLRDEQVASFTAAQSPSASASASASSAPGGSGGNYDATVTVSRVIDGDTIEISPSISGIEDVRLIGVDTPETVDPNEEVEPYGLEASNFATSELEGERVGLEFDQEKFDDYDRLLGYVYIDGQMFNKELVEQGYAQAYPYEPNTRYANTFEEAQQEARASGLGIWGLSLQEQCQLANRGNGIGEGSAGCEDVGDGSASATSGASASATTTASATATATPSGGVTPISEQDCPPSAPIKGNDSSSGELIYHTKSSATYEATYPEECFDTEAAAQAAGYRKAMD
jgi:micrococcal nuclease